MTSPAALSWRWVLGVWSALTLLAAFSTYATAADEGRSISIGRSLWIGAGTWLIWAILTPAVVALGQRWPLDRALRIRFIAGHLAAAIAMGVLASAVAATAVYGAASRDISLAPYVSARVVVRGPMGALLYFTVLCVSYLAINTRRLREGELLTERLSRELSDAQLGALRMQLHPHFLFNSLNAVTALVRDHATDQADRALTVLSDVLRTTLRRGVQPHVRLRDEIAFIRNYLELETLRFADRLRVTYAIAEDLWDVPVPTFILQPLVENALKYGLMDLPDGGTLRIQARRDAGTLVLAVVDDGAGLASDWQDRASRSIGISNVRARLAHMYGAAGRLSITAREDGSGTNAIVEVPIEEAS